MIENHQDNERPDKIVSRKEARLVTEANGLREKMKPKALRKGGRKAVESNEKRWGIGRTGIASEPLFP